MLCKLFSLIASGSLCASAIAEPLSLGASLPSVSVADQTGSIISLADYQNEPWLLVYFYPKADTPGCTKQACSLRDSFAELTDKGVTVIGVSHNSVEEQKAFQEKYKLPFTLLADEENKVIHAFGVPQFPVVGLAKRQAYLFKSGTLTWRDLKASTSQQAADIMAAIQK